MMSAVKSPMQNIVACLETEIKKCAGVPIVIPCVVFGSCLCLIPSMSVCGSFENQKMCGCTHIYTPCSLRKSFVFNTKQSGSFENQEMCWCTSSSPDLNTLDSIVRESFPEDSLEGMPV